MSTFMWKYSSAISFLGGSRIYCAFHEYRTYIYSSPHRVMRSVFLSLPCTANVIEAPSSLHRIAVGVSQQ